MKLSQLFRRRGAESEMTEEMRFHVDMEAADLERAGWPPDEARRQALASFGGVRRYREEGREARGGIWLEHVLRDARYSARSLARSRAYTVVVVLTLGLGIAATTSIFSAANGILFKRLPYREPSKLLVLWDGMEWMGIPEAWVTGTEVVRLRSEMKQFEGFSAIRAGSVTIGGDPGVDPQQVTQSSVSANFFQLLGSGPDIGRGFIAGEDAAGGPRVAVISRRLWTQRFGADRTLIGKTALIDGTPTTIVGVLPAAFRFEAQTSLSAATGDIDVYMPLTDTLAKWPAGVHTFGVLARVRSDASVSAAMAELRALDTRLDAEVYAKRGFRFVPITLQERMVREVRPALVALVAAVVMLMLIMSANLAVLALVRAARRERELMVRRAIGASRGHVSRQILIETVILSFTGATVGTGLGVWALRVLLSMAPPGLPRRDEIGIDVVVLGVTVLIALAIGIGIGLAPVIHSARGDIATVLREKSPSRTGGRLRRTLVLAQLALSMVLLAGTGLLLGSFVRLLRVDPGFDSRGVLTMELVASRAKYKSGRPVVDVFERYAAALRALPGVTAVGATGAPPLSAGADQSGLRFPTRTNPALQQNDGILADVAPVTPGYLAAMGIGLLDGSDFNASHLDSANANVAIIDELLAKRYFPTGRAVGQPLIIDGRDTLRVIGVARHVRMYSLQDPGREQAWVSHRYTPYRGMVIAIRTKGDPTPVAAAAQRAIHAVDPEQAINTVAPMATAVRNSLAERRLVLTLVGMFAGAALLLAALGVYGVTANSVNQRTREIGIRMALGATHRNVIWSVLAEPTGLVIGGLAIGAVATLAGGRLVRGLLYGLSPTDPATLTAVGVVLTAVGLIASYFPARRATHVDPMVAFRSD
jgi:putative ABC transport system permease protein